jgi:hypothetical protein
MSYTLLLLPFFAYVLPAYGLTPYTGDPPSLPDRSPFGFGSETTGGAADDGTNTYLVDNMVDLRTALTLDVPRVVYVKGELEGNEINSSFSADCQWYIDNSPNTDFNFTQYIMAYNETYMDEVEAAADAGEDIDGYDAAELYDLLKHQNVRAPAGQPACEISNLTIDRAGAAKFKTCRRSTKLSTLLAT